jgi:hypothetical protein
MTTLREIRDVIHGLEQQRLEFLTRKGRGELVRRFPAESLAATLVRDARDRAQLLPHRHAALLANKYRLDARAVHNVLTDVIDELMRALARQSLDPVTVLEELPAAGWPPGGPGERR